MCVALLLRSGRTNRRKIVPTFSEAALKDKQLPNAVLIEYIPDLHRINLSTYSDHRMVGFCTILEKIYAVGIYHGNPYPRNMTVQTSTNRVVCIDFDLAQTFSGNRLDWQRMKDEKFMVDESCEDLTEDFKEGKLSRGWYYYYKYL
ncbi:conserved hypothetical protein, partial [Talaromyces stipitatus ATCC 10500]